MELKMEERLAVIQQTENSQKPAWVEEVRRVARGIRRRVLEHTVQNNGGYLSQACSAAEIFAALYVKLLRLGPVGSPLIPAPFPGVPGNANRDYQTGAVFNGPKSAEFDRFILSPSQYALVLYATLVEAGRMAPEGLQQFNQDGSSVEMIGAEHSPGMEVMTGSLGQGLSQAAGLAMARKRRGERGRVWVFMSDGELQSGQNWEAMQAIAFHQLDNLRIIVDVNQQQCDGAVAQVMQTEPLDQRLAAFGARVRRIDGHNIEQLAEMAELEPDGRALVILADTDPCAGIELLQARAPKLHYIRFSSPGEQQAFAAALAEF
jgi:transketolase